MTDEYEHNGLGVDGERVLGRLIDLVRGRAYDQCSGATLSRAMTNPFSAPALRAWYVTKTKQNG